MDIEQSQIDKLINIPSMARSLSIPGLNNNSGGSLMCYGNGDGSKTCFVYNNRNEIMCKNEDCFISYRTVNQSMLGNGKKIKKLGNVDMLLIPNGLSSTVVVVGRFPRNKMRTLKKIIGNNLRIDEVGALPALMHGLPNPPKKCHLFPFSKECNMYINNDDFTWIPGIGMKKMVDLVKNPKNFFKSEIKFNFNKFKNRMKKTRAASAVMNSAKKFLGMKVDARSIDKKTKKDEKQS